MEIDIGAETFTVYADEDTANAYAAGALHADPWRAASLDTQRRALVTATRIIDRQTGWKPAYDTQAKRLPEQGIIDASIEMAFALVDGSELQNQPTNGELIRSITAGSVSITNFRGVNTATRFPQIVTELLRPFLGGSDSGFLGAALATGTDAETIFPIEVGLNIGV